MFCLVFVLFFCSFLLFCCFCFVFVPPERFDVFWHRPFGVVSSAVNFLLLFFPNLEGIFSVKV